MIHNVNSKRNKRPADFHPFERTRRTGMSVSEFMEAYKLVKEPRRH